MGKLALVCGTLLEPAATEGEEQMGKLALVCGTLLEPAATEGEEQMGKLALVVCGTLLGSAAKWC